MPTIVPDANLFIKLLIEEKDSKHVFAFCKAAIQNDVSLVVPELFKYEVFQVACGQGCPADKVINLIDVYESACLICRAPTKREWKTAVKIASAGHPKSGYPSIYDAIYHAMAVEIEGVFITADRRHFEKSKEFGHIAMLSDWEKTLNDSLS